MSLDASIPLRATVPQPIDTMQAYGRLLSLRDAADQAEVRSLQTKKLKQDLKDDEAARAAIKGAGGDVKKAADALATIDPKRAVEIYKALDDRQKAALAQEKEVAGLLASEFGSVLAAPPEARQGLYAQTRARLLQRGVITADAAPEQWDDNWGAQVRQRAMTGKEQIDAIEKALDQEIQRERDAEAARQHDAAEKDREAQRREAARHNKAQEETAGRNATAAERRAAAAERNADNPDATDRVGRRQAEQWRADQYANLEKERRRTIKQVDPETLQETQIPALTDADYRTERARIDSSYRRMIGEPEPVSTTPRADRNRSRVLPPAPGDVRQPVTPPAAPTSQAQPTSAPVSPVRARAADVLARFRAETDPTRKAALAAELRTLRAQLDPGAK